MEAMVNIESAFRGKTVWLSGHTGFKGSWLAEWLLLLGARVVGYALPPPTHPALYNALQLASRMESQIANICDADCVARSLAEAQPDYVFHLAAQPIVRQSYDDPVETYLTNVMGTIHVLEGLRQLTKPCSAVFVTTDKCYENHEWLHPYREEDPLGGHDPYSSSKGCAEIAIASWRRSFFQDHPVRIASARAGNVIGGGDWARDRIVPDAIRSLEAGQPIRVRNPASTRPWQHVLEPLSGYLALAEGLAQNVAEQGAYNFGPNLDSNRSVRALVEELLKHYPGSWIAQSDSNAPHEAGKLNLDWAKAFHLLGWQPRWGFSQTIEKTAEWYLRAPARDPMAFTQSQILAYTAAHSAALP